MKRLLTVIHWIQFLGWCAFWLWSAVTDDNTMPWRMMFSMSCMVHAWDRAFNVALPKNRDNKPIDK